MRGGAAKALLAFAAMAASQALADSLDVFDLFRRADTWRQGANSFVMSTRRFGFAFSDAERTAAASSARDAAFFHDIPVFETRVYWRDGALARAEISIYNRGDAAVPIRQPDFDALVRRVSELLAGAFGKGAAGPAEKPGGRQVARSLKWDGQSPMALLEWSYSQSREGGRDFFAADYVRVTFVPKTGAAAADQAALTGQGLLAKPKSRSALRKAVVKTPRGDVYIAGVPMVDQGEKGYCAASTVERVLRHYGLQIDQHQVAQLAETSAAAGTTFAGFSEAVGKIGRRFALVEEALIKPDDGGKGFEKSASGADLGDYNKAAKKMGRAAIDWRAYSAPMGARAQVVDIGAIWNAMDPEVLLAAKTAQKSRAAAFRRHVYQGVDAGVPLMWSCLVGIFPEVPDVGARGVFGHMRLVIGYNKASGELLYSDTWGGAHALKRMPMDQAWAMTQGLVALRPRN